MTAATPCPVCGTPIIFARTPDRHLVPVAAEPDPAGHVTIAPPVTPWHRPTATVHASPPAPGETRHATHYHPPRPTPGRPADRQA